MSRGVPSKVGSGSSHCSQVLPMQSSPVYSSFTALALKIAGLIMIVYYLLDCTITAIPYNPLQLTWQIGFTTLLVERGLTPLVGIALLFAGYRLDNPGAASVADQKPAVQDLRFWVLSLSALLGLIFLLLVPFHFNNMRLQSDAALEQINNKAKQAEDRITAQGPQIEAQLKDPKGVAQLKQQLARIDQAIESGQVPAEQLDQVKANRQLLETITKDPTKAINQEIEATKNKIRSEKLEVQNRTKTEAMKSGLRIGLNSLFLAIGYIVIGWTGLRSLLSSSASRSKT